MRKKLNLLFIGLLALILVACAKNEQVNKDTSKTITYSELSAKDKKNIEFSLKANADVPKKNREIKPTDQIEIKADFDLVISNKTKRDVVIDLSKLNINDSDNKPTDTTKVVLKKDKVETFNKIFTEVPWQDNNVLTYDDTDKVDSVMEFVNQSELDEWVKENAVDSPAPSQRSTTNEAVTVNNKNPRVDFSKISDRDLERWITTSYAKTTNGKYSAEDFYCEQYSSEQGVKCFVIKANHNSPNMRKAGANSKTSPVITHVFINPQGQLVNETNNTILSDHYEG